MYKYTQLPEMSDDEIGLEIRMAALAAMARIFQGNTHSLSTSLETARAFEKYLKEGK